MTPTLLGVPFDAGSSFQRGAALAPPAIRKALRLESSNTWTEDGTDVFAPGVIGDAGDLSFPADADWTQIVEQGVTDILARGGAPLVLGGDHAITYPVVRAMAKQHPGLSILHFDAHGDLYDSFEGNQLSHACPFARIMENGLAKRLVQVGIRTLNDHQRSQISRFGVEVHEMRYWVEPFGVSRLFPKVHGHTADECDPEVRSTHYLLEDFEECLSLFSGNGVQGGQLFHRLRTARHEM